MKKQIIIKMLVLSVLFSAGCSKDFIDLSSPNEFTNEVALSSMSKLQDALIGAYAILQSEGCYGEDIQGIPEAASDNVKKSQYKSSGRYLEWYAFTSSSSTTATLTWVNLYSAISRANNIINAWPEADPEGTTESQRNQILGEALFIRALCHFNLVNFFSQAYGSSVTLGVPVILETRIQTPPRNSITDVYTQVTDDLEEAARLMSWGEQDLPYYATVDAANALLARVYLYKGDWQNAARTATLVINSGHYELYSADEYVNSFRLDGSSESIFEIMMNESEPNFPSRGNTLGNLYSENFYGDLVVNKGLYELMVSDPADVRSKLLYVDASGEFRHKKFPGKEGKTIPEVNNTRVIRLSEMYLTRAEANISNSSSVGASPVDDINAIRTHRGLTALASVDMDAVRKERRIELAFEGFRLFDLKRWDVDIDRSYDCNLTSNCIIPRDSYLLAMPIPEGEMAVNRSMVQNPNY